MPDITVIVPVYNIKHYIAACLDSLMTQRNVEFEVLCIDDGSTDGSNSILTAYAERDSRIKVYFQKNAGLSSARNLGLENAVGEFVYFLDGDDRIVGTDSLFHIVSYMRKWDLDVYHFDGRTVFETQVSVEKNKYLINAYAQERSFGHYATGRRLFADMVLNGHYNPNVGIQAYRREFLLENGLAFAKGRLYEDKLFSLQTALAAGNVAHEDKVIYEHLVRANSIMRKRPSKKNLSDYMWVYTEAWC